MTKLKRVTPYKQRAKKVKKCSAKDLAKDPTDLIDTSKAEARIELMSKEELLRVQQLAAQKALNLFSELMTELTKRIPAMTDEVLSESLLSVWEKIGNKK